MQHHHDLVCTRNNMMIHRRKKANIPWNMGLMDRTADYGNSGALRLWCETALDHLGKDGVTLSLQAHQRFPR